MVDVLLKELTESGRVTVQEQVLADADKVLILLSEGVLEGTHLSQFEEALAQDRAKGADRVVMVCRTSSEGWVFGAEENPEIAAAPAEVQQALNGHEAMTFRAPSNSGSRHEFPALLKNLLDRLAPSCSTGPVKSGDTAGAVQTVQAVRQQLETARQVGMSYVWAIVNIKHHVYAYNGGFDGAIVSLFIRRSKHVYSTHAGGGCTDCERRGARRRSG